MSQKDSYEIKPTQKHKIYIATSGISSRERDFIKSILPKHIELEDSLSTATSYLATFRCMFTDKYIQAVIWKVPIISAEWLYDITRPISRFLLHPFEGSCFTTSEISNDIFKNYFLLLGSTYKEDLDRNTDFLISDREDTEKTEFCRRFGIPIVHSKNVFDNEYSRFKREYKFDVLKKMGSIFSDLTFFIDPKLPQKLFNVLKRLVIENDGIRTSLIDDDADYVISSLKNDFYIGDVNERRSNSKYKILHYQYIFDCSELQKRILPDFYFIYKSGKKSILGNVICYIDKNLNDSRSILINKISVMGGVIKTSIESGITHLIIKNRKEYQSKYGIRPYKVVLYDWIDQCLYNYKQMKEDKYLVGTPTLRLYKENQKKAKMGVGYLKDSPEMIFQFTGLSTALKNKAIEILEKYNIKFIDGERYENSTHLIMGTVNTSEKFMCSLARGCWILIPDFIYEFNGSSNFDFEKYEWKNDGNLNSSEIKIVESVKKLRLKVQLTKKYIFCNWVVKFYCEDSKLENLVKLIEAGGGRVTSGSDHTHVFVSKKFEGSVVEEKSYGINYIFAYMFK